MDDLVFVTGNMDKVHWVEKFLGFTLEHHRLDIDEIQDIDPVKVLEAKAKEAYRILQRPVLVEDTSLVFQALGKLPGPFIKYFLVELGEGDGLIRLLDGFTDKRITQTVLFCLYDGVEFQVFEASGHGLMASEASSGTQGFGFDKIFFDEATSKTRAEMTEEEYAAVHPRKAAVIKLAEYLKTVNK